MHCTQMKTEAFFFFFFFYNFHCVYIQTIIHLFIFIIITISSISVNMWQNSSGCCCLWSGKAWVKHATGLFFFIELINFTKIILGKKYTCRSIDWKWQIWSIFTSICSKIRFSKFNANRIFCLQKQNLLWIIRTILCHNTVQQLQWDFMLSYAFRTTLSFFYSFHTCHT